MIPSHVVFGVLFLCFFGLNRRTQNGILFLILYITCGGHIGMLQYLSVAVFWARRLQENLTPPEQANGQYCNGRKNWLYKTLLATELFFPCVGEPLLYPITPPRFQRCPLLDGRAAFLFHWSLFP